jgi:putative redox protein
MHFVVSGRAIPAAAVARAVELSHERYCSASIMLGKTAEITTSHELVEVA